MDDVSITLLRAKLACSGEAHGAGSRSPNPCSPHWWYKVKRQLVAILLGTLMIGTSLATVASAQFEEGETEAGVNSGYDGGPVEVTMYHHVYNLLDTVPMNTQPMDPASPDIAQGRTAPTISTPAGEAPISNKNYLFMYNSPGVVHYNTSLKDPRVHPERGLGYDILLGGDEIKAYWYMSADAAETLSEPPVHAGAMPELQVKATLRLGDDIGGSLTDGQVVAEGTTTVNLVTPPNGGVTEIPINLGSPKIDRIPAEESFNLQIKWAQVDQGDTEFVDRQWNLHTGTEFPNRMVWSVKNPVRMNYVHPQPIGEDKIAIHTAFVTPMGNYDVDLQNLSMEVTGPDGETVIEYDKSQLQKGDNVRGPITVQKTYKHNSHHEPVLVTWVWNYRDAEAPPGEYEITATASNLQNSASASKTASFTVEEQGAAQGVSSEGETVQATGANDSEGQNGSPLGLGPLAVAILGALGLAAYRRRD